MRIICNSAAGANSITQKGRVNRYYYEIIQCSSKSNFDTKGIHTGIPRHTGIPVKRCRTEKLKLLPV